MFDASDLATAMETLDESQFERLEVVHFDNHHFTSRCSENFIYAYRASKADIRDPASLWLLTLRPSNWARRKHLERYVESSLCRPIEADEYFAEIDKHTDTQRMALPALLRRRHGLLRAPSRREARHHVAVMGEYEHDFVVFHWETTV